MQIGGTAQALAALADRRRGGSVWHESIIAFIGLKSHAEGLLDRLIGCLHDLALLLLFREPSILGMVVGRENGTAKHAEHANRCLSGQA
jgi:hypothetical protein